MEPLNFPADDDEASFYRRACQLAALNGQPSPLFAGAAPAPDTAASNVIPWPHTASQTKH